mgnify:CR=1 FL=1
MPFLIEKCQKEEGRILKIEYRTQARATIDLFRFIAALFFCPKTVNARKGNIRKVRFCND